MSNMMGRTTLQANRGLRVVTLAADGPASTEPGVLYDCNTAGAGVDVALPAAANCIGVLLHFAARGGVNVARVVPAGADTVNDTAGAVTIVQDTGTTLVAFATGWRAV